MAFNNGTTRPADHRVVSTGVWRNAFFPGEPLTFSLTTGAVIAGWEVRNYYGTIVASGLGDVGTTLTVPPLPLGWYKLYLTRAAALGSPWLAAGGEATFCVVRADSGLLGARPALETPTSHGAPYDGADHPTRGFVGIGPHRLDYKIDDDPARNELYRGNALLDLALMESTRQPDPVRPYRIFTHSEDNLTPENEATNGPLFDAVVADMTAAGVFRFEVMNEPNNFGVSPSRLADMVEVYHRRAKAVHPDAKILGPSTITVHGNQLDWTRDALALCGNKIEGISFHNYNGIEGDLVHGRANMDGFVAALTSIGQQDKERINSEAFSYFQAVYGSYEPRLQAQWTMLEMHLMEQYAVPKENCSVFYDMSHGFWSYPSWWMHQEGGEVHPGPLLPVVRVWSEELHGKAYSHRLDFGTVDNSDFIGSRFTDPSTGAAVVAVQSDGRDAVVRFQATGAPSFTVVSPWGDTSVVAVEDGWLPVDVSTLPVYIRVPPGAAVTPEQIEYGVEAAVAPGVIASAHDEGNGAWRFANALLEPARMGEAPFLAGEESGKEGWARLDFTTPRRFDVVRVSCPRPWQTASSILEADVQILTGGEWVTIGDISEDPATIPWTSAKHLGGCFTDSFWGRTFKWTFRLDSPVDADAVRVVVHDVTYGGGATLETTNHNGQLPGNGGQTGPARLCLREIEVYLSSNRGAGVQPGHVGPFLIT